MSPTVLWFATYHEVNTTLCEWVGDMLTRRTNVAKVRSEELEVEVTRDCPQRQFYFSFL